MRTISVTFAFFPVDNDDAIGISFGDCLIRAGGYTGRVVAMVAGCEKMGREGDGKFALLNRLNMQQARGSGGDIMPVFAGDNAGKAAGAACLVEVETELGWGGQGRGDGRWGDEWEIPPNLPYK